MKTIKTIFFGFAMLFVVAVQAQDNFKAMLTVLEQDSFLIKVHTDLEKGSKIRLSLLEEVRDADLSLTIRPNGVYVNGVKKDAEWNSIGEYALYTSGITELKNNKFFSHWASYDFKRDAKKEKNVEDKFVLLQIVEDNKKEAAKYGTRINQFELIRPKNVPANAWSNLEREIISKINRRHSKANEVIWKKRQLMPDGKILMQGIESYYPSTRNFWVGQVVSSLASFCLARAVGIKNEVSLMAATAMVGGIVNVSWVEPTLNNLTKREVIIDEEMPFSQLMEK